MPARIVLIVTLAVLCVPAAGPSAQTGGPPTADVERLSGGASHLASLLVAHVCPGCSPVAPRDAVAASGDSLHIPRGQSTSPPPAAARVLFIGNSLTYANDLPGMIEALAAQAGLEGKVIVRAVARPNVGLEDHWNGGEARRAIERERWTLVVLQQGPTSLPESRAVLREYAKKFAFEIKKGGARVALYGVWPPSGRAAFFDAVTESYARAADDVGGALVPVGEGWRAAWRRDPSLPLYGPDGFHPSPMGTYVAALMFLQHATARSPIGLPSPSQSGDRRLRDLVTTPAQLLILQEAAAEANQAAARRGRQ